MFTVLTDFDKKKKMAKKLMGMREEWFNRSIQ
jgi:hypothetical protein